MEQSWRSRQTPRRHDVSWPYGRKRNVNTERGKRHRRVARTMVRFTGGRSLSDWRGIAAGAGVWPGVRGVVRAGGGAFAACGGCGLVSIGKVGKHGVPGAAVLGLLTGISLCPPFVAAGVRAAELGSMAAAILFFGVFFVATTMWFVPFVGLGCVRRNESVIFVARAAMSIVAVYYLLAGIAMLAGRKIHG